MAAAPPKLWRRDHLLEIEEKVRGRWEECAVNEATAQPGKESFFVTFPYPYMNGRLHLGHAFSLTKSEFSARFQRLNGKNVLFPLAFHCTGMPICAAANKVKKELAAGNEDAGPKVEIAKTAEEDKLGVFKGKKSKAKAKAGGLTQIEVLLQMGIPEEKIPEFADPNFWLQYFPPFAKLDCGRFGLSADWRRSFITTEVNPYYDRFIRWQFNKLKAGGHIKFGKREAIYSIAQGQPCADHDRSSGEGVGPQEYSMIKLKVKVPKPEWEESIGDADVFLVAATLRPETMYGQAGCFVLPEGDYGFYLMNNDEVFVCCERSAINMYYQGLGDFTPGDDVEALLTVKGKELVGLPISAPLCQYETVYVLPMLTISMGKGTGIVTSVPADSPDDYACLKDWKTKENMRTQHGVDEKWADFEPVPIIEIVGTDYGPMAAVTLCENLKVQSHKDKDKLAQAKKEVYLKGFYSGVMTIGPYKGKSVREAKTLVRDDLFKMGGALRYWEPENEVISRSGDQCIVAFCDQWYLTYGDEKWTEKVRNHVKDNFNMFNTSAHNALLHTVDWMGSWACSRQFGLGTRLPWDESWLIESLSDSTIYMAYYTFAHLIQGGRINGDKAGPWGIKPEDLTDEVFDYLLCKSNTVPTCNVPTEALEEMRKEFEYWYPMNLRVSGKDLIQNHLTMALFNHAAVWPDQPELWPRAYYTNGHVMVDAQKMSKSVGNFLTLKQAIDQFGADATRLACADAGDTLEDANFSREVANNSILRLTTLENFAKEVSEGRAKGAYRSGDLTTLDEVFLNEISRLTDGAYAGYSGMMYREALRCSWFEMQNARDEYRDLTSGDMHGDALWKWLEVQCIILSPICPHFCEYLWKDVMQNGGFVVQQDWPSLPQEDKLTTRKFAVLKGALRTFRLEKDKLAKGKKPQPTTNAVIYVAKEYAAHQQAALKVLQAVPLDENNAPADKDFMRSLRTHPDIEAVPKELQKHVLAFASFMMNNDVKGRGKDALELQLPFDEMKMLVERRDLIVRQLGVESLDFKPASECPEVKKAASPGQPCIVFSG